MKPVPDKTLDVEEINPPTGSTIENKEKHLLHTYLEHQDAMKVRAKTVTALTHIPVKGNADL